MKFPFTWTVSGRSSVGVIEFIIPSHFTEINAIQYSLKRMATSINLSPVFVTEAQVTNNTTLMLKVSLVDGSGASKPTSALDGFVVFYGK